MMTKQVATVDAQPRRPRAGRSPRDVHLAVVQRLARPESRPSTPGANPVRAPAARSPHQLRGTPTASAPGWSTHEATVTDAGLIRLEARAGLAVGTQRTRAVDLQHEGDDVVALGLGEGTPR